VKSDVTVIACTLNQDFQIFFCHGATAPKWGRASYRRGFTQTHHTR